MDQQWKPAMRLRKEHCFAKGACKEDWLNFSNLSDYYHKLLGLSTKIMNRNRMSMGEVDLIFKQVIMFWESFANNAKH